jgi:hypothetical protein
MRLLKTKKGFRKEFKRQLRYAIAAACGFLIVFAWRDAIISLTKTLMERIVKTTDFVATDVGTAITITVIGVGLIVLSSKLLKD